MANIDAPSAGRCRRHAARHGDCFPRRHAARCAGAMTENHVTGLPVMDGKSRCIGLITASDILGFEEEHAEDSPDDGMMQHFNNEIGRWESVPLSAFGLEEFGDVRVEEVMARDLISVGRDTPLKEVCPQDARGRRPPRAGDGRAYQPLRHRHVVRLRARGRAES